MKSIRKKILGIEFEAHPIVFPISAGLIIIFVVFAALAPHRCLILFNWMQSGIAHNFAWLYIFSMSSFLIFVLWLCLSRYGNIRLGADDESPEFPTATWFAMLFSAGMGIGMLFFGVAEPMWHYLSPPSGPAQTLEAARKAMGITFFHWCLHPWALYALVALALAYFGFRRGLPLSFRSVFYPIIGERIYGWPGHIIDILAVLATLFGLATSLGLGAKQVNAGLNYVFGVPQETWVQVLLIAIITSMAVASLVSGLHVGIRRLSELNMGIAAFLLLFLFIAGPTVFLLNSLVENIGAYLQRLPANAFWTATYESGSRAEWFSSWTVFYWGWWIAWSPFVGMFIARVSKGRTIRQFIVGVLLIPSAVAILWMTGFGNSALHQEIYQRVSVNPKIEQNKFAYQPRPYLVQEIDPKHKLPMTPDGKWLVGVDAKAVAHPKGILLRPLKNGGLLTKDGVAVRYNRGVLVRKDSGDPYRPSSDSEYHGALKAKKVKLTLGGYLSQPVLTPDRSAKVDSTATAMFLMLQAYPWTFLTALLGVLSVVLFFVTSSDSASMVADIIASGGSADPALGTRLFWGILEGVLAAVLLLAGGLVALQTGAITIGLPFCIIIILMCVSLIIGLRREIAGAIPQEQKLHIKGEGDGSAL